MFMFKVPTITLESLLCDNKKALIVFQVWIVNNISTHLRKLVVLLYVAKTEKSHGNFVLFMAMAIDFCLFL